MTSHQSDRIIAKSPSIAIPLQHRRTNSNIQGTESLASRRSITMLATSHRSAKQIKRLAPGHSPLAGGKSFESRVLIDIDSPNFITMEQKQHDEIVNSFRNYYMKDLMQGKRKSSSTSANSASISGVDDEDAVFDFGNVTERLSIHNDPHLNTVGGDITRELYRIGSKNQRGVYKNKSYDDLSLVQSHRRGSTASALNVPGGFRREYIVSKIRKDVGAATDGQTSSDSKTLNGLSMYKVPFLTRNFLEFLYVDGHFAGESFDEDFDIVTPYTESTDEMTPLLTGDVEGQQIHLKVKTSTFKAFLLLIKSFVGTGVLFLPNAFNQGGLLFSTLMLLFFSVYSFWCYYALIRSKVATGVSSFGDIGLILFGPWMKFVILLSLVLTQIGFAGAYIVFTAKNLIVFIENVFSWREIRIEYMLLLQLAIFIPLSFVRTISKLSLSSLLANCFVITGLLIVIYHTAKHFIYDLGMKPEEGVIFLFNPNKWSLFIGTAIFAFEGVGLIIPVQDSMRHPEKFPMVLAMVILTTAALFVTVGVLGYLAYGKYIQNVILFNLPQQALSVNLIQLFYSIAILLTTPLQLFPVIAIIENKVFPQFIKIYDKPHDRSTYNLIPNTGRLNWKVKWTKNLVRSIIVTFVILIAYFGVDNLDLFVSLVGCFACIPLVYMYPPMLHLRSCSIPSHENQQSFASLAAVCFDYVLIIFGGVSTIYTTYNCLTN